MKRPAALFLALLLTLSLVSQAAAEPHVEQHPELEIVEIGSLEAFLEFSVACSRDIYSAEKLFRLTADIDLTNSGFTGIPYFAGTFDGNGHRIFGLSLTGDGSRQGLFRRVAEGAVIKELNVNGTVTPGGTRIFVGGIAGINAGKILHCSFIGKVEGLENVGGIAGQNEASGVIDQCSSSGSVSGEHQVGGIAGQNAGVVSRCQNSSSINTEAIVPQSEKHFDLALLSEDNFLDLTNIGGIAGDNSGVVSACDNSGEVGYQNTGYNVGGIAGKTSGFVTGCENVAAVRGRRDVGGIAGQLVPNVRWDFADDKLAAINGQLGSLNYLIHKASSNADENISALTDELSKISGYTTVATRELEKVLNAYQQSNRRIVDSIHVDPESGTVSIDPVDLSGVNTAALTGALADINAEGAVVSGLLQNSFHGLTEDMANILRQMTGIMGSMSSILSRSGDGELFDQVDLSVDESYEHDIGAVDSCVNYGEVFAENNAGGVAGTIGFEVSFDMEDTLNASQFLTSDAKQYVFAVLRGNKSHCEILAKNNCVGCVVGAMDVGAVVGCVGTGAATSQSGDFVGGIAGQSKGSLVDCWTRAVLKGKKYVGGAAGFGGNIDSCRCWTVVESASEYAGAVAGWAEGEIAGNIYVDSFPVGIDNVSLSGMTDPVSQEELLALEDLPENFNDLTVRFVVDGDTVKTVSVPFGGSVVELPEIENDGVRYWKWDAFNGDHIYHNLVVSGKYYAPGTTLSSGEEIPLFLVEGVFYEGQTLTVVPVSAPGEDGEELLAAYTLYVEGYDGELTVHMLCHENGDLYIVGTDGERLPAPTSQDGQYVLFRLENGSTFEYVKSSEVRPNYMWIAAAGGIAAVGAITLLIRRKKKKTAESPGETTREVDAEE